MRITILAGLWIAAAALAGCTPNPAPNTPAPPMAVTRGHPSNAPRDPEPATPLVFHVEIFRLEAPLGTFSTNEEFWKRIDEQCLDPATSDLLQRNGIRVGIAPLAEMEQFSRFMEEVLPAEKLAITGTEVKDARIPMKAEVPGQNLFHFDKRNELIGRTFDRCENVINVSFQPAPRKPGELRLTVCPVVRALRKRLQFTQLNSEYEMQYVNPEWLYDLNFKADIPVDSFMVITPSPHADKQTSVGNAFLIKNAAAEQLEQLLIIVPQRYRVDPAKPRS